MLKVIITLLLLSVFTLGCGPAEEENVPASTQHTSSIPRPEQTYPHNYCEKKPQYRVLIENEDGVYFIFWAVQDVEGKGWDGFLTPDEDSNSPRVCGNAYIWLNERWINKHDYDYSLRVGSMINIAAEYEGQLIPFELNLVETWEPYQRGDEIERIKRTLWTHDVPKTGTRLANNPGQNLVWVLNFPTPEEIEELDP